MNRYATLLKILGSILIVGIVILVRNAKYISKSARQIKTSQIAKSDNTDDGFNPQYVNDDAVANFSSESLSEKERMLVGRWYYTESYDDMDGYGEDSYLLGCSFRGESVDVFKADGTEVDKGIMSFYYSIDDYDWSGIVILQFNCTYEGVWKIEGDSLILKGKKFDMEYVKPKSFNKNEIPYRKELLTALQGGIPDMRKSMLKKRTLKIVRLTDDEFVYEEDGEETSCVRLNN